MKKILYPFIILFCIAVQNMLAQNMGVNTMTPSAKFHIAGNIDAEEPIFEDYETGDMAPILINTGDADWFITSTDAYQGTSAVKSPFLLNQNDQAELVYSFAQAHDKEVTVEFHYKYIDESNTVSFGLITNEGDYFPPQTPASWKFFTTTFVSNGTDNILKLKVSANVAEANPLIIIDNLKVTYEDGHAFKLVDGTQADGRFLQSDALGHSKWYDLRGEYMQAIEDNHQSLTYNPTFNHLTISDGNTVVISGLRNSFNDRLTFGNKEISTTSGVSLLLPDDDPSHSYFHYDHDDGTFYLGTDPSSSFTKGFQSVRWGFGNKVQGNYSTGFGANNTVNGTYSTIWGTLNTNSGNNNTIWGTENEILDGYTSTLLGRNNTLDGSYGLGWGFNNASVGDYTTSWGYNNQVTGDQSTSWGKDNVVNGTFNTASGLGNNLSSHHGTAWGNNNSINGVYSTIWGINNGSTDSLSSIWGKDNMVTGKYATVWGSNNNGNGNYNTIGGKNNNITENYATAFGSSNHSSGNYNFLAGISNNADGTVSTHFGYSNYSQGIYNYCFGYDLTAYAAHETIFGRYNYTDYYASPLYWNGDEILFSVGNGTSLENKKNAITILKNGNIGIGDLSHETDYLLDLYTTDDAEMRLKSDGNSEIIFDSDDRDYIRFKYGAHTRNIIVENSGRMEFQTTEDNDEMVLEDAMLGLSRQNPSFQLHLGDDDAAKPGSSSWTVTSDQRLKRDIVSFEDGLDLVKKIKPVWFTYNGLAELPEETFVGTIAQELEKVAPYMIKPFNYKDAEGNITEYKSVNYGAMDFVLVNAIQEQQKIIVDQQLEIDQLKSQLQSQQVQIDGILSQLNNE